MTGTRFSIKHVTKYSYSDLVSIAYNEAKLTPRSFTHPLVEQNCIDSKLILMPKVQDKQSHQDSFGNKVHYFCLSNNHTTMAITSSSVVIRRPLIAKETLIAHLTETLSYLKWEDSINSVPNELKLFKVNSSLLPFIQEIKDYARPSFEKHPLLFDAVYDLMNRIFEDFSFKPGVTTVTTSLKEVVETMEGVCQDYSHFMVACLRSMGLASRYVSGYLETLPPPGEEKLQGVDASHAWVSVYVPGFDWLDFDPTNNIVPLEQHVTIAWGRDYADVPPLKGVLFSNASHKLDVAVDMVRQDEP